MHIKKFEARDLREALGKIRSELGPDAVILETSQNRTSSGGVTVLAALPREMAEVPAMRSNLPSRLETAYSGAASGAASGAGSGAASSMGSAAYAAAGSAAGSAAASSMGSAANSMGQALAPTKAAAGSGAVAPRPRLAHPGLERSERSGREPARMNFERIERKAPPAPGGGAAVDPGNAPDLSERVKHLSRLVRSDHFSNIPLPLRQLYFDLTDAEVDADLVFQILQRMGSIPLPGQFTPAPPGELLRLLRGLIAVGGAVEPAHSHRVIALVGPTGVGKTTTVAKIAGHAAFHLGMKVGLVSSDAYRVFGAQHLASYAALMGLPFESIASASELRSLLRDRFSRVDLVLIDTSGRSPRDPRGIEEVHHLLGAYPDLDCHLVLSATSRARDLALALDAFSLLPVRHLIFTKLDEATSRGGIFTTALKARRPVSYLGTGQEVPDDLEPATLEAMTGSLDGLDLADGPDGPDGPDRLGRLERLEQARLEGGSV